MPTFIPYGIIMIMGFSDLREWVVKWIYTGDVRLIKGQLRTCTVMLVPTPSHLQILHCQCQPSQVEAQNWKLNPLNAEPVLYF